MYENGMWVFGYGSLLWRPGFDFSQKKRARLDGFHRSFCMYSVTYRGTQQNPGLVLALDVRDDAYCEGVAFFVAADKANATLEYLRERELVTSAYYETSQNVTLEDGTNVEAVCYVIDRDHSQFTGELSIDIQADMIAGSIGDAGPNWEYLFKTTDHLADLGIQDSDMETLANMVTERRRLAG